MSTDHNQPTGQFYHVALDNQFPFHVYGASQDEGAYETPSAAVGPGIGPGEWHAVAFGESTFVAPDPDDPYVTYGSGYYSSFVRVNRVTGRRKERQPVAALHGRRRFGETKYRFGWTHPIFFSPANPNELLVASQVVFLEHGSGTNVDRSSVPTSRATIQAPKGRAAAQSIWDQTGAETFPDIASLAVSPLDANMLVGGIGRRVGSRNERSRRRIGALVTPPQLPQWAQISSIEPSHTDKGTAYLTASRYMWDDYHPYVYMTTDYGAHWTTITNGLPSDQYVFVVRQDPREPRLLFAGTRSTVYVSLNGGALLAAAHAGSSRRASSRSGDRHARRRARRRNARTRVLDSRQRRAARAARAAKLATRRRKPATLRSRDGVADATPTADR